MFIAGCEAVTKPQPHTILVILDQAGDKNGLLPFKIAKNIMSEVWRIQDEQQVANIGETLSTWMDGCLEKAKALAHVLLNVTPGWLQLYMAPEVLKQSPFKTSYR
jgi:hypothetical protein